MIQKIPNTLFVLLHGYTGSVRNFDSVINVIFEYYENPIIIKPSLELSLFSFSNPYKIVTKVTHEIQSEWDSLNPEIKNKLKIIFIGHSIGSLIARKIFIIAHGEFKEAPYEWEVTNKKPLDWRDNIERLILLAGINKGYTIRFHNGYWRYFVFSIGKKIGNIFESIGLKPLMFNFFYGDPFVVNLRVQTLCLNQKLKKLNTNTLVIQLLGTNDSIVAPEDSIDLETGSDFIYIDVPDFSHLDLPQIEKNPHAKHLFVEALIKDSNSLKLHNTYPADSKFHAPDPDINDVVFVLHGIRDTGYWTQKLARKIKKDSININGKDKIAMETSSYGFFPILSFLFKSERKKKVQWLIDQYIENRVLYPNASFSFIGHSHGTYLLSKAISTFPFINFKNVILAGSMVPTSFDWKYFTNNGRISTIFNFVSSEDWVVGIFAKLFEKLNWQDIGSGGFDGFMHIRDTNQIQFIKGDHSSGVEEKMWQEISHIILHNQKSNTLDNMIVSRPHYIKILSAFSPIVMVVLLLLLALAGLLIYWIVCKISSNNYYALFSVFIYIYLLFKFLKKM